MTPLQQLLAFLLPLLCSLYVLVSAVRACWPRRRAWNRRRPGVLGAPHFDERDWSRTYMDSLKPGRFG